MPYKQSERRGKTIAGKIIQAIGDAGKGIVADISSGKSLTQAVAGALTGNKISPEQAAIILELEVKDRESARKRDIEVNKSEHASWLSKNISAILAVTLTLIVAAIAVGLFYVSIPEKNEAVAYTFMGSIATAWVSSIAYYFGSSSGSQEKNKLISMGRRR